jgi:hypothetical protein
LTNLRWTNNCFKLYCFCILLLSFQLTSYSQCHPSILDIELAKANAHVETHVFAHALRGSLIQAFGETENFFLKQLLKMPDTDLLRVFHAINFFLRRAPGQKTGNFETSAEALIRFHMESKNVDFARIMASINKDNNFVRTCQHLNSPSRVGGYIYELLKRDTHTRSRLEELFLGAYFQMIHLKSGNEFASGERMATPGSKRRRWDSAFDFIEYQIEDGSLYIHTMGEIKHREHSSALRQMQATIGRIRRVGLRLDGTTYSPEQVFIRSDNNRFKQISELKEYKNDTSMSALRQTRQFRHAMVHLFLTSKKNEARMVTAEDWGDLKIHTEDRKGKASRISLIGTHSPFIDAFHYMVMFYLTQPELQVKMDQMALDYHFSYDLFIRNYFYHLRED